MAKLAKHYKYANPHEWLDEYLTGLADANDITGLFLAAKDLALRLDGDAIQDEYQSLMDADAYFDEESVP